MSCRPRSRATHAASHPSHIKPQHPSSGRLLTDVKHYGLRLFLVTPTKSNLIMQVHPPRLQASFLVYKHCKTHNKKHAFSSNSGIKTKRWSNPSRTAPRRTCQWRLCPFQAAGRPATNNLRWRKEQVVHTRAAHGVSSISSGLGWSLPSCKMGFEMQQLS